MIDVGKNFRLARITFGPCPFLLKLFRKRIGVLDTFDVATGAGVTVPEPGTADAVTLLKNTHTKSGVPEFVQSIEPAQPGTDDNDIEIRFNNAVLLGGHFLYLRAIHPD